MEDLDFLRRYVQERSDDAFHELVRRKLPLVYAAALRQVGGDDHRANDVTQAVFTALATQAKSLVRHPSLTGWLYKTTRYAALAAIRTERRRQHWEKESSFMNANDPVRSPDSDLHWDKLGPVLDEAMHALPERDREAVLLRYFEAQPLAAIGRRLGLSEDAARKRIDRALERLQQTLAKRGVVSTATALMTGLAQGAIATVPTGLAAATSVTALATAVASSTAGAGLAFFTMSKTTLTAAAAIAVLALGAYYQVEASRLRTGTEADARAANQTIAGLQADVQNLRQQLAAVPATPATPTIVVAPNPDDELIARLTALSRTLTEGGLASRVAWTKPTLGETVAGIAKALEVSPDKIATLQKIADDTQKEILANALRESSVKRFDNGVLTIHTKDLPENRTLYDRMLESFTEIMGPSRYGFFESLNAKEAVNDLLVQNGLGVRTIDLTPPKETRPNYLLGTPTKAGTEFIMPDGRLGVRYPPGMGLRLTRHTTREELKAAMGPFGALVPDDF